MPATIDLAPILALPVAERIAIAEAIWASIPGEHYAPGELPDEFKEELDRRHQDAIDHPDDMIPWEVINRDTLARLKRQP